MLTIYSYGCTTCGINGFLIRKIQAYGVRKNIPVEVINSKYSEADRQDHAIQLKIAGITLGYYPSIVVNNGKVMELRQWKP